MKCTLMISGLIVIAAMVTASCKKDDNDDDSGTSSVQSGTDSAKYNAATAITSYVEVSGASVVQD